jgi:hypothetical protein
MRSGSLFTGTAALDMAAAEIFGAQSTGTWSRSSPGSTSSRSAGRVSRSPSPANGKALTMSVRSGPSANEPFAHFDPDTSSWRTSQLSLPLGNSSESQPAWPRAGIASRGSAFPLPPWAPRISARGSSSSPLLKTPTAQLAVNGGAQHPDKRKAGGHGPTLADEVEFLLPTPLASMNGPSQREIAAGNPKNRLETEVHLLPTPRATDGSKGGPNQRGSKGDLMLPSTAALLPTPIAADADSSSGANPAWKHGTTLTDAARSIGPGTPPRSSGGKPSSDDPHPPLPLWEPAADAS